jgi:hypothetical protein
MLAVFDTGASTESISLRKSTAESIGIERFPKYKDGYIIPLTLQGLVRYPL